MSTTIHPPHATIGRPGFTPYFLATVSNSKAPPTVVNLTGLNRSIITPVVSTPLSKPKQREVLSTLSLPKLVACRFETQRTPTPPGLTFVFDIFRLQPDNNGRLPPKKRIVADYTNSHPAWIRRPVVVHYPIPFDGTKFNLPFGKSVPPKKKPASHVFTITHAMEITKSPLEPSQMVHEYLNDPFVQQLLDFDGLCIFAPHLFSQQQGAVPQPFYESLDKQCSNTRGLTSTITFRTMMSYCETPMATYTLMSSKISASDYTIERLYYDTTHHISVNVILVLQTLTKPAQLHLRINLNTEAIHFMEPYMNYIMPRINNRRGVMGMNALITTTVSNEEESSADDNHTPKRKREALDDETDTPNSLSKTQWIHPHESVVTRPSKRQRTHTEVGDLDSPTQKHTLFEITPLPQQERQMIITITPINYGDILSEDAAARILTNLV